MSGRGLRVRALGVVMATLVAAAGVVSSHASTASRLERAEQQLHALTDRVRQQEAAVEDARARAADAAQRAQEAERAIGPLLQQRAHLALKIAQTQATLAAAQRELDAAAVEAFIASPGTEPGADTLAAVLGADTIDELQDRLAYGEAVARDREAAIRQVAAVNAQLQTQADAQDALIAAAEDIRLRRDDALRDEELAWQQGEQALVDLAAARDNVVALIDRLRAEFAPADIAEVAAAFQGEHNITYGDWAKAFLQVMGAPTCRENLVVAIAWQAQEGTQAAWNPLATTHRMEGSTDFNSVGVQNYRSLGQGLAASKETIRNGWDVYGYGPIIESMRDCAGAMHTARAIADSRWCYGCAGGAYVLGIVPAVEASFETYAAL